ncbi:MAG: hypothetical protein WC916_03900 [Candidatus Woesearchaeota archaeon]
MTRTPHSPVDIIDRVEDIAIIKLPVPGFEELEFNQKIFLYHLWNAAVAGDRITYQQQYKYGLQLMDFFLDILEHGLWNYYSIIVKQKINKLRRILLDMNFFKRKIPGATIVNPKTVEYLTQLKGKIEILKELLLTFSEEYATFKKDDIVVVFEELTADAQKIREWLTNAPVGLGKLSWMDNIDNAVVKNITHAYEHFENLQFEKIKTSLLNAAIPLEDLISKLNDLIEVYSKNTFPGGNTY